MGTHPIFESDFDCLTDWIRISLELDDGTFGRRNNKVAIDLD